MNSLKNIEIKRTREHTTIFSNSEINFILKLPSLYTGNSKRL